MTNLDEHTQQVDAAVDNDVLIKAAALDLVDALVTEFAGVLGQARFVVPKRVARMPLCGSPNIAEARAVALLRRCEQLEPNDDEVALATAIERAAARRGLQLDGGESQLAAIVVYRSVPELHTGDKRAIASFEAVVDDVSQLASLAGRVRCLEQIIEGAVGRFGADAIGAIVCDEPNVDKTLTICAECHGTPGRAINAAALQGYIKRLRSAAPRVLAN